MKTKKLMALGRDAAVALSSGTALEKADGAKLFKKKCGACHSVEPGKHKLGPSLAGIVGHPAGTVEGFTKYNAMKGASFTWDEDMLAEWITDQKAFLKNHKDVVGGNKTAMNAKIKKEDEREAIIDFLKGEH